MKKSSDAPVSKDFGLRDRIKSFAEKHNFIVSEFVEHKIKWSEEHEDRCFCDPDNRICPCNRVYEDMANFNGRCLCNLFWKPEAYENWKYYSNKPKKQVQEQLYIMSEQEYKEAKKKVREVWKNLI